jgi:Zn-finger nucleic acid-binding protein
MRNVLEEALDNGNLEKLLEMNMQSNAAIKIQKVHTGKAARKEMSPKHAEAQQDEAEASIDVLCHEVSQGLLKTYEDNGSLEKVLQATQHSKAPANDLDQVRDGMRNVLEEALDNGNLEKLLEKNMQTNAAIKIQKVHKGKAVRKEMSPKHAEAQQDEAEVSIDVLCNEVSQGLLNTYETGVLEEWLRNGDTEGGSANAPTPPPTVPAVKMPQAPAQLTAAPQSMASALEAMKMPQAPAQLIAAPQSMASATCSVPLLEAIGNSDRRIGVIVAKIEQTLNRIAESDAQAAHLGGELQKVCVESQRIQFQLDHQYKLMDDACARGGSLQEAQKKLADRINEETLQLRHAQVELEASLLNTARSEISAAASVCTMGDINISLANTASLAGTIPRSR